MKARSAVPIHIQEPFTLFGLPPILVIATLLASVAIFIAFMILGIFSASAFTAFGMVALAVTAIIGFTLSYLVSRHDPHVITVFMTARRFWGRGRSSCRTLLAGAPSSRSREGRS